MGTVVIILFWVYFIFVLGLISLGIGEDGLALRSLLLGLFFIVLTLGIGFLPTWIALARRHQDRVAIVLLNVFTDWTIIGWVGALVWSLTGVRRVPWER